MAIAQRRWIAFVSAQLLVCALIASFGAAQDDGGPPLNIQTSSLPRGFVSQTYKVPLQAQNGITPYKWLVTGGALPKGLSLSQDGVLAGTPVEAGLFHFVITATDSAKPAQQRDQEFVLQVLA